nr:ankyrin repeat family protein [Tanacetum cinerariifolium]
NVTIPSHGFNELHYAAMAGSTSLAEKLVKKDPLLLFKATELNYLPIHMSFGPSHKTFGFLLQASKDHIDKCKLNENHSHFEAEHGAVLLNVVIGAGLMEVAYELITANPGLCTIEYEIVKHALMKIVENFDLYYSQPEESRNLDHNIAKKLQAERRDRVDQRKLPSCLESESLLDEVKEFPESEVEDKKPLLLLRSICNKLHKKDTLFDTRYYFMEAATL